MTILLDGNNRLELCYLANVVLYFTKFNTITTFVQVSKKCKESLYVLKTNPLIEYGVGEKIRNWANKILLYFPNIQTLRIKDLSVVVPKKVIEKIVFIKTISQIELFGLKQNESHLLSSIPLTSPCFKNEKGSYFFYDTSRYYIPGYPEGWLPNGLQSIGTQMYENSNNITGKLADYSIVSNSTAWWFICHMDQFKSLRCLTLIMENEIGNEWTQNNKNEFSSELDCLENILSAVCRLKYLEVVKMLTISNKLSNKTFNLIKKHTQIKFIIVSYDCCEKGIVSWLKVSKLRNVSVLFKSIQPEIVDSNSIISQQFSPNFKYGWYSVGAKKLCSQIDQINYIIWKMLLEMSIHCTIEEAKNSLYQPKFDLSELCIKEMHVVINTQTDYALTLPKTLNSLLLSSELTYVWVTIHLNDINFSVQTPELKCLQLSHLHLSSCVEVVLPYSLNYLKAINCSNIVFKQTKPTLISSKVFQNCKYCDLVECSD